MRAALTNHQPTSPNASLPGGGRFAGRFGQVVFAVLDRREDSAARAAFATAFGTPVTGPGTRV